MKGPAVLRILLIAAACTLGTPSVQAAQYAKGRLIPEVRLRSGTVLHDVTVIAVGATTVIARWNGGQGSILLTQLPDEMRTDLTPVVAAKPAPTVAAAAAPAAAPAAVDPKLATAEIPTEIKLTNGFIMHKSTVTRWDTNSVLINYQGGIVTVLFKNMAPEHRAIFEARKDEALSNQAKDDAASAPKQDSAAAEEEAKKEAAAAQEKDALEKIAESINNGISFHYLVKGMTKEQAIQAFGRPQTDNGDTCFYVLRGHDKYGNPADRMLSFKEGLLVGWRDQREGDPAGAVDH